MDEKEKQNIAELRSIKSDFDAIGKAIAEHTRDRSSIGSITLDLFYDRQGILREYIVLRWLNGEFEARNAECNSLIADIMEAAKLLNGGYYVECDAYAELKDGSKAL
jgi:hypothetical protein